ncbi:Outer membrane protein TolC [Rhizobiales bacterium GAS188]|nr:Outer membrane protein TolC [Rhizobiales bacterium GAS188]
MSRVTSLFYASRRMGLAALLTLGGCATFSPDGGMSAVSEAARADLGKDVVKVSDDTMAAGADARVQQLLKKPLNANSAVQLALLSNKGLQAAYNALGISEAQFVQASLPPNPVFSVFRLGGGMELEIERRIVADLLALMTLPARRDIAETKFRTAQLRAIAATLKLAADTRRQYVRAVAANQQVGYLVEAKGSADTAAELAKRLGETGAMNKLDQSREYAFYAELSAQLAKARLQQRLEKERLTRLMGLWGQEVNYALPSSLPALPKAVKASPRIEAQALERRVDLKLARGDLDLLAKQLGLTKATRFVNALALAGISNFDRRKTASVDPATGVVDYSKEKTSRRGLELDFEVPIYDFGEARSREAEETYMQAVNRLAEKAIAIRSEAREAYLAYRGSYDIARNYQGQVLPLRQVIQDESLLHYNGMLIDVFQLIQDGRARILSNVAAIDARRDFWIADADLKAALIGGGMDAGGSADAMAAPAPVSGND